MQMTVSAEGDTTQPQVSAVAGLVHFLQMSLVWYGMHKWHKFNFPEASQKHAYIILIPLNPTFI